MTRMKRLSEIGFDIKVRMGLGCPIRNDRMGLLCFKHSVF
jgi:hypothetical protein